jgi:hypothetical protein
MLLIWAAHMGVGLAMFDIMSLWDGKPDHWMALYPLAVAIFWWRVWRDRGCQEAGE